MPPALLFISKPKPPKPPKAPSPRRYFSRMATDWAAVIATIDAAIQTRIDGGVVQEYEIRGRRIQYASLPELTELRDWASRKQAATKGAPFSYGLPRRAGG